MPTNSSATVKLEDVIPFRIGDNLFKMALKLDPEVKNLDLAQRFVKTLEYDFKWKNFKARTVIDREDIKDRQSFMKSRFQPKCKKDSRNNAVKHPGRKLINTDEKRNTKEHYVSENEPSPFHMKATKYLKTNPNMDPPHVPTAVWLDPQEPSLPYWWAGMAVPHHQMDDTMPTVSENEWVITFWDSEPKLLIFF